MVVHAFPAAKLGALVMKQVSKPIANFLKERAKGSPFFRVYVCMPPAHFYNWCEVKMKMYFLNLGRPVTVPKLNEAMAIDLGANILGEGIIFIIAAGILFFEYSRQVRKEEKKEAARKEELTTLNYTIQELYFQLERQDAQIRELHRALADLDNQVVRKPWSGFKSDQPPSSPPSSGPKTPPSSPESAIHSYQIPEPIDPHPSIPKVSHLNVPLPPQNISNILTHPHPKHLPKHPDDLIPIHLEHVNKVVADNPGVILTAVAYLTSDIFKFKKHEYYTEIHLQK